jgi:hypothetical protein
MFPDTDFVALGLTTQDIIDLHSIGGTEQTHVTTLNSAIAGAGAETVQPCTYDFKFTTAAAMVGTAGVLENIGVSAYVIFYPRCRSVANTVPDILPLHLLSRPQEF